MMFKFKRKRLPRLPFTKEKVNKTEDAEQVGKLKTAEGEIIHVPEPETEFQTALREVSEKIRGTVNGFVNDVLCNWNAGKFGEPHLTYTTENELSLSFTYLLENTPKFDVNDKSKKHYDPTISIFLESIFGQRVFTLKLDKLLNQEEIGATLFREDLISLISGELADSYLMGHLGGISPDFEADYEYTG